MKVLNKSTQKNVLLKDYYYDTISIKKMLTYKDLRLIFYD